MTTQYEYSADPGQPGNDFTSLPPGGTPNLESLGAEITADVVIDQTLEGLSMNPATSPNTVFADFVADLSVPGKAALDAVIAAHTGVALVETPQRENSLAEQTEATTTPLDVCTMSVAAVRGGNWQVTFYCEISVEDIVNNSGVFVRLFIDGAERAFSSSSSDQYQSFSGAALLTYSDGDTPELILQIQRVGAANTAKVRRCQVAIVPEDV